MKKKIVKVDSRYSTTRLLVMKDPLIIPKYVKSSKNLEDIHEPILYLPKFEGRLGEGGLRTKGFFKVSGNTYETLPTIITETRKHKKLANKIKQGNEQPIINAEFSKLEGKPLVTVITVVYNGEKFLDETISSVINQTYENLEYIVIDGGSTDSSLDIIKKYEHAIDYWVSEKDTGIYDAMNKGIRLAKGDIIGLINADDYYETKTIELVAEVYKKKSPDIIFGNNLLFNQELKLHKIISVDIPIKAENMNIHSVHPTVFVARSIYKKIKFNTNYKIAADYDFLLRVYDSKYRINKIDKLLSVMRIGGASYTFNFEVFRIKFKRFGLSIACFYLIKVLIKKFIEKFIETIPWTPGIKKKLYKKSGWYSG